MNLHDALGTFLTAGSDLLWQLLRDRTRIPNQCLRLQTTEEMRLFIWKSGNQIVVFFCALSLETCLIQIAQYKDHSCNYRRPCCGLHALQTKKSSFQCHQRSLLSWPISTGSFLTYAVRTLRTRHRPSLPILIIPAVSSICLPLTSPTAPIHHSICHNFLS